MHIWVKIKSTDRIQRVDAVEAVELICANLAVEAGSLFLAPSITEITSFMPPEDTVSPRQRVQVPYNSRSIPSGRGNIVTGREVTRRGS